MVRGSEVAASGLDIGLICQGWEPDVGGVESHAADLARALAQRGHRCHVLCLDYGEGLEPYSTRDAERAGVAVRRMAYRYHDQSSLDDVIHNDRANDAVLAWLAETPCDLVHVHHATGFGLGALAAIDDVGQPLVMTLHDYWALCPRGQMLRHDGARCEVPEAEACGRCLAATWPHLQPDVAGAGGRTARALDLLRRPQRLFTPSERARAVYARAGLDPARIQVVENGVETEALADEVRRLRSEVPRPEGELRLGLLGSVLPSKGALELARAFLRAEAPGLTLEIHGNEPDYHGDGSYVRDLRALADDHPRLRLHGAYGRGDLPRILAGLDGVAAPSRWEEVFGLTVREARAAGLPVLVSDAGGLPAVAADGQAGLVVPAEDEGAWTRALERFASDAQARARWAAHPAPVRTGRRWPSSSRPPTAR